MSASTHDAAGWHAVDGEGGRRGRSRHQNAPSRWSRRTRRSSRSTSDADGVEAQLVEQRAVAGLGEPGGGHPADLRRLAACRLSNGLPEPARRVLTSQKTSVWPSESTRSSSPKRVRWFGRGPRSRGARSARRRAARRAGRGAVGGSSHARATLGPRRERLSTRTLRICAAWCEMCAELGCRTLSAVHGHEGRRVGRRHLAEQRRTALARRTLLSESPDEDAPAGEALRRSQLGWYAPEATRDPVATAAVSGSARRRRATRRRVRRERGVPERSSTGAQPRVARPCARRTSAASSANGPARLDPRMRRTPSATRPRPRRRLVAGAVRVAHEHGAPDAEQGLGDVQRAQHVVADRRARVADHVRVAQREPEHAAAGRCARPCR